MTTDELHDLAATLGLTIATHDSWPKGWYQQHTSTISLRSDLCAANYRCTLAHEIGHASADVTLTVYTHFWPDDVELVRAAAGALVSGILRDGCGTGLSPIPLTTPILVYVAPLVALTMSAYGSIRL